MKNLVSKASFGPPLLLIALLSACNEPGKPATDFSVDESQGSSSTAAGPMAGAVVPTEISLDERRIPLVAAKECNLERANGGVFTGQPVEVSSATAVTLSGWVASAKQRNIPAAADIRLTNTVDNRSWKIAVQPGGKRDDVMALLGGDAVFANPGFAATFDARPLPAGSYRAFLVFRDDDALKSCDNGRAITVKH